jgi:hypothetical protein
VQVTAYIADWNEAMRRRQAGTLQDFAQAVDNGETWIQDLGFGSDSHGQYCAVADAYEELREMLPGDLRNRADRFMNRLITFDGYAMDIGDEGAIFALSISPESAAGFAALSRQVDFAVFKAAFHAACSEKTRAALAEDSPDTAFEGGFLPYIEMWISALQRAAAEKKGLLIHWG